MLAVIDVVESNLNTSSCSLTGTNILLSGSGNVFRAEEEKFYEQDKTCHDL